MAYFRKPMASDTLEETALTCSFQLTKLSICTPRYFKKFWRSAEALFSYKNPMSEKITLIEDGRILSNCVEVAGCLMSLFVILRILLIMTPFSRRCKNKRLWKNGFESDK